MIGMILAIFDLQYFLTNFESSGLSVQKKFRIDFQDGDCGDHLGFPIRTILAIFFISKSPRYFLPNFKSIGISIQEIKFKIDFQDSGHGSHFEFPIETISAIFDLQVTQILPTKFQVSWSFGAREEIQYTFS